MHSKWWIFYFGTKERGREIELAGFTQCKKNFKLKNRILSRTKIRIHFDT